MSKETGAEFEIQAVERDVDKDNNCNGVEMSKVMLRRIDFKKGWYMLEDDQTNLQAHTDTKHEVVYAFAKQCESTPARGKQGIRASTRPPIKHYVVSSRGENEHGAFVCRGIIKEVENLHGRGTIIAIGLRSKISSSIFSEIEPT